MRFILLAVLLCMSVTAKDNVEKSMDYCVSEVPKKMSTTQKKSRFYHLVVPVIDKVHTELMREYNSVKEDLKSGENPQKIALLKESYKVKSDEALLAALKPHPRSIVIAQAALESAWGTSRFFCQANNLFGMWSTNKNEKRIAAKLKRKGNRTVWLKKFDTLEESIRAYYRLMAKGRAFKEFRKARYASDDVHMIVKKLDKYSEIGSLYAQQLSKVISYNKLTKYDYEVAYNTSKMTASK